MKRLLIISLLCLPLLAGCNMDQIEQASQAVEEISAGMQDVQAAVAEATAQKAAIDLMLADMPPGDKRDDAVAMSATLDNAIAVGSLWIDKATMSLDILQMELAAATEPLDVAGGVIKAAQPFIPAPWGAILLGASGLVIGLIKANINRRAARNIAASVEPTIKRASAETKAKIAAAQSTTAAAIVDESQSKKLALPF